MPADLGVLGAMLAVGLRQLASEQQAEYRRISDATHQLRDALAAGDKAAVAKAATALCDAEYAVRGDCEIFGRFVDELKGSGLVPDDFESELFGEVLVTNTSGVIGRVARRRKADAP